MSEINVYLNEYLTCKIFQKYCLNPVLLPSFNNVCEKHVKQNNKETDLQSYKCNFCL